MASRAQARTENRFLKIPVLLQSLVRGRPPVTHAQRTWMTGRSPSHCAICACVNFNPGGGDDGADNDALWAASHVDDDGDDGVLRTFMMTMMMIAIIADGRGIGDDGRGNVDDES